MVRILIFFFILNIFNSAQASIKSEIIKKLIKKMKMEDAF